MVLTLAALRERRRDEPALDRRAAHYGGYREFFNSHPWPGMINSATAAIVSTLLVLALATPTAYALSIRPVRKWSDVMFFFLSTKFLPAVAALLPVYLIAKNLGLLDNIVALVLIYAAMNLPIAVLDDAVLPRRDARGDRRGGRARRGEAADADAPDHHAADRPRARRDVADLLHLRWNELMFARVLTSTVAGTSPVFLTGFITSEGLFLAKLCAAAMVVSLPVIIAGFAAQDKLVQGLSMGAVK